MKFVNFKVSICVLNDYLYYAFSDGFAGIRASPVDAVQKSCLFPVGLFRSEVKQTGRAAYIWHVRLLLEQLIITAFRCTDLSAAQCRTEGPFSKASERLLTAR